MMHFFCDRCGQQFRIPASSTGFLSVGLCQPCGNATRTTKALPLMEIMLAVKTARNGR